ncbi:MAG: RraA family protein [Planctomycetota bacterium]|jgi:regulator of RNase E activity RraA
MVDDEKPDNAGAAVPLGPETLARLRRVGTATLTMQLLKRGLRAVWMAGPRAIDLGPRLVGEAFTLRFVPQREDLARLDTLGGPGSTREAIEAVEPGKVVVIDACGLATCGTLGDILAARLQARGAAGVVTDGGLRDFADVRALGLPVYCAGPAAPPSLTELFFVAWQETIGCGGVAVVPGDLVVGDEDGVVVVPRALADQVAEDAQEQERFERYVRQQVDGGEPVTGLYPPNDATLAAYRRWLDDREPGDS